ncbi:ABC transporter permease [Salinibacterium sp. dk2585]|uniref:ABC transporter permease n=1 Tax=unclassified Salinibacterium TaxID=2632331 RepID=UPI0011C25539|nr:MULTISPECIES: ABC transporter permease [unclassified Salinibacterium]QEE60525.1 ABC transporter permease [Salinibacterium sp. dk2585]TXK55597.1 ABC transporter permease [Salinibacterium sp. dk5596]
MKPGLARRLLLGSVLPIALVAVWSLSSILELIPRTSLPAPWKVVEAFGTWIFGTGSGPYDGTWIEAIGASGGRVLLGFSVALVLGVVLGVLAGYFRPFGELVDPFVQMLRPIPSTAWVPLTLVFFGFGFQGAVFLIALGAFFPIFLNTMEGIRGVTGSLTRVGRMLGSNTFQLLRHFVVPASLPNIFIGIRLSVGLSWVLVVVAEMLSVRAGIGYTLMDAYSMGRYDVIISAMITLGLLGFLSDRLVVIVQNSVLKWHRETSIQNG